MHGATTALWRELIVVDMKHHIYLLNHFEGQDIAVYAKRSSSSIDHAIPYLVHALHRNRRHYPFDRTHYDLPTLAPTP
ncbi:Kinetochore protein Sos7 [Fusarium oxysporum f. sp. albedinis]|nr:Kinetochore protein Sos7 [Fusarium oxysporum f. sp. albedinis]